MCFTASSNYRTWLLLTVIPFLFGFMEASAGEIPSESKACVVCHKTGTPGVVNQWMASRHEAEGVSCFDCHQARESSPASFKHNGRIIKIIVSPEDCGKCHEGELVQFKGSHHAKAGQVLGSLDNLLGELLGGVPAVQAGCRQCHGDVVKVGSNGRPTSDTWPNTGMGRINPDGSPGSCSACHCRHEFSVRQARQPEGCGKCHLGPDHPHIEVWNESKHGVMYHANREKMNLGNENWRAGEDYFAGPTCASCHMCSAGKQGTTHDVGERLSLTLRPPISTHLNMVIYEDDTKEDVLGDKVVLPQIGQTYGNKDGESRRVKGVVTWQQRRKNMQNVCKQCHSRSFVRSAYVQFDNVVDLYNNKFAKPAMGIMEDLRAAGIISSSEFDDPIEWTWWELWHHEGRRARHGAAMQGPDYTWWHGIYEVAKHFYGKFIPELRAVAGSERAEKLLGKHVYSQSAHLWHRDGFDEKTLDQIEQFYQERYGK